MITYKNVFRHEFIGLQVKIAQSSNNGFKGLKGKIIDETKNTIKIEDDAGNEKIIPKNLVTLHLNLPGGAKVEIDGKILTIRPEDRIKKRFRK